MAKSLYDKIASKESLKKAWHYVRKDAKDDFLPDLLNYQDFAANLEDNLLSIRERLLNNSYQPKPLLEIDVPKSNLAVRPGSAPEIEDRIVTMAIAYVVVPIIDVKISPNVYSDRVKEDYKKSDSLFKDIDEFKNAFLKQMTIIKFNIFEEWYEQWPDFADKTIRIYEKEGFNYLVTSDIVSYFENISHDILKVNLIQYLKDQKTVNLIINILNVWSWKGEEGYQVDRGIPQGNDFSSWLGTIYLIPLDSLLDAYAKKNEIKYIKYCDDVRIFAKKESVAREILFKMNTKLRDLHLNIQSSKTDIYIGEKIKEEFADTGLESLNEALDEFEEEVKKFAKVNKPIPKASIDKYYKLFLTLFKEISYNRETYNKKDSRFFRRLITAFKAIKRPDLVGRCVKELYRNPDSRLTRSIVKYFKEFPKNTQIQNDLTRFLLSPLNIFDYQTGWFLYLAKYFSNYPKGLIDYARKCLKDRSKHWFVKAQATSLLSLYITRNKRNLKNINRIYDKESNSEFKRALLLFLVQLNKKERDAFFRRISFSQDYKVNRLAKFLLSIFYDKNMHKKALNEIKDKYVTDRIMIEQYFKLFLLQDVNDLKLLTDLEKIIKMKLRYTKNANLKNIYEKVLDKIKRLIIIIKRFEKMYKRLPRGKMSYEIAI